MKRYFLERLCLVAVLALPLGCGNTAATTTTPPAATAPGYANSTDQQIGQTLAGANAFFNKLAADQKTGAFKPSAAEVTALNKLQAALAIADPLYTGYHAGTQTLAVVQQAVANVVAAQTAAQTLIGGTH